MKSTVKKWGNSAAIRIPASIMRATHLDMDHPVDVREEDGRIIIESIKHKNYDLHTLLNGITPQNGHGATDFGDSEGNEIW